MNKEVKIEKIFGNVKILSYFYPTMKVKKSYTIEKTLVAEITGLAIKYNEANESKTVETLLREALEARNKKKKK